MVEQLRHIWKPYLYGMLAAVMLALVVAVVGGLFVHAPVEPASLAPLIDIEFARLLTALATIVACAVVLLRFNVISTLLNMLQHLVRYRGHD
jgi:L-lactate permease